VIRRIDHIGIAVENIDEAIKLYTQALGLKVTDIETVTEHKVKIAMIHVGESKIELLEPTHPEGNLARYIEKRGEGLHHLALEVSDIEAALGSLKTEGIPLVDETPRIGAGGSKVAFLHPKGANRVSIELVEPTNKIDRTA
jgi:lactoylglutathione lyase/methylmalonyl-CoA/ethylmalonyl-CoA epimerase